MILRRVGAGVLVMLALGVATPASAAEYRLRVASVLDDAFRSFMRSGEAADGATGPGLERLEASLDGRDFPKAVLLSGRHVQSVSELTARAWGGVAVKAEVKEGGTRASLWDEARWEGVPGEQSVWFVTTDQRREGEVSRVALKGVGRIRHYTPYGVSGRGPRLAVARFPLDFLFSREDDADFWSKQIAPALDLGQGIAVVVADTGDVVFADHVYIVVSHAAAPTTYKVVLGWRDRTGARESPAGGFIRINGRW